MSRVVHPSRGFFFISYLLLVAFGLVSLTHATVRGKPSRASAPPNPSGVCKADGDQTQGRYAISEWWLESHTQGPEHTHTRRTTFFMVMN